jgi:ribonuclease R
VPIGSALDAEAFERGTSVYFPDRAIAMLPERLSNDLCSLQPNEERRTVSAVLTLDKHGETVKAEFFRSLIRSRARLTYTAVGDFLEGSPSKQVLSSDVTRMLRIAHRAAGLLRAKRSRRGSLDFDLPDADVILGEEGDVVEIVRAVRNEAHRLIEEFMLAANEAVAKHLEFVPTPALYRVHDRPDESRLVDLRVVLGPLGYDLPEDEEEVTPATFQAILDQAAGKPEERFISDLVLRAQKKAIYSEECRGHYALAAKHYCHFTSPIRRYPDLLVHRALVEWLAIRRPPAAEDAAGRTRWFHEAAAHCSSRERRAESAEREAVAWKKFVFLSSRVGEEFWAYVSAVVGFGLFVTLEDIYVDGLVPISSLEDDFYRYEDVEHRLVGSSSGRVYRLGDRLRVKLVKADAEKRGLDFVPVGDSAGPRKRSRVEAIQRQQRGRGRRPSPAPPRGRTRRRR